MGEALRSFFIHISERPNHRVLFQEPSRPANPGWARTSTPRLQDASKPYVSTTDRWTERSLMALHPPQHPWLPPKPEPAENNNRHGNESREPRRRRDPGNRSIEISQNRNTQYDMHRADDPALAGCIHKAPRNRSSQARERNCDP